MALLAWASTLALGGRRHAAILVLVAFAGAASASLRIGGRYPQAHFQRDTNLRAYVTDEPRYPIPGEVRFSARLWGTGAGSHHAFRASCSGIDLPWKNLSRVEAGSSFTLRADMRPISADWNPFSAGSQLRRRGISATCRIIWAGEIAQERGSRARQSLESDLLRLGEGGPGASMFISMLFGTRDLLSRENEKLFRSAGLSHLLVVSGYQVTMVFAWVSALAMLLCRASPLAKSSINVSRFCAGAGLLAASFFVAFCRFEASSVRAWLALTCLSAGRELERTRGMLNQILGSLLIMATIWPGCYLEAGTQLTFAALSAICLSRQSGMSWSLRSYVSGCWLIYLFTSTVCLAWFGQLSLSGYFLNLALAPAISIASCPVALVSLGLYWSGLDATGFLLRALFQGNELLIETLRYLDERVPICINLDGALRAAAALGLLMLSALSARRRLRGLTRL